jgi:ribosome-associated toxin RatA of RatAB toxin-antitoxin module
MSAIRKSALVPFAGERMYDLVAMVQDYPKFLPWCSGARAGPAAPPAPAHAVDARVDVDFYGLRLHFETRNLHTSPTRIEMSLLSGPFRSFAGDWRFRRLSDQACKIEFSLDYQLNAGVIGAALAPVFDQIASTMVDAFVKRAEQVYGGG